MERFRFFNVSKKKIARLRTVSIVILYSQQGMQQLEKRFGETTNVPFWRHLVHFDQNSNEPKKREAEQYTQIMIVLGYNIFSANRHFEYFK